jgi:hypothetical protein
VEDLRVQGRRRVRSTGEAKGKDGSCWACSAISVASWEALVLANGSRLDAWEEMEQHRLHVG